MDKLISVVVPVYNVQDYLERCTDSLLCQRGASFEIILVDDGSTDLSGKICDDICARNSNVSVIHKSNGGLASARNAGLEAAHGEYILFIDSDDWVEQGLFVSVRESFTKSSVDLITFGFHKRCNEKILVSAHAEFDAGLYDREEIRSKILPDSIARKTAFDQVKWPSQLSACMCAYRLEFLNRYRIRFEPERHVLNEDWLFNICCLTRADKMIVCYDYFYNYDTRNGSLSMTYKSDTYERKRKLYSRYAEELKITGNDNPEIQKRLVNFWLESVYNCVVIEFYSQKWKTHGHARVKEICRDAEFRKVLNGLNRANSTPKGLLFKLVVKTGTFGLLRFLYLHKDILRR